MSRFTYHAIGCVLMVQSVIMFLVSFVLLHIFPEWFIDNPAAGVLAGTILLTYVSGLVFTYLRDKK